MTQETWFWMLSANDKTFPNRRRIFIYIIFKKMSINYNAGSPWTLKVAAVHNGGRNVRGNMFPAALRSWGMYPFSGKKDHWILRRAHTTSGLRVGVRSTWCGHIEAWAKLDQYCTFSLPEVALSDYRCLQLLWDWSRCVHDPARDSKVMIRVTREA